jgi:hypothetical protein
LVTSLEVGLVAGVRVRVRCATAEEVATERNTPKAAVRSAIPEIEFIENSL